MKHHLFAFISDAGQFRYHCEYCPCKGKLEPGPECNTGAYMCEHLEPAQIFLLQLQGKKFTEEEYRGKRGTVKKAFE